MAIDKVTLEKKLVQKVGPIGKVFLKKAMDSLGIEEINEENLPLVLDVLKLNAAMKKYVEEVEKEL